MSKIDPYLEVGCHVTVPYKSLNEWNEGHRLSGEVLEIKDDKVKVDLPFASRDEGWYDIDVCDVCYTVRMRDEDKDRIDHLVKAGPTEDGKLEIISLLIKSKKGATDLAKAMVAPVRNANKKK